MNRPIFLRSLLLCSLAVFMRCSIDSTAGGNSSEIGNGAVSARLYNPGGTPAANATVMFIPVDYNPRTGGLGKTLAAIDSARTDAQGNYTVALDSGLYTLIAEGDSGMAFCDSIAVSATHHVEPRADTLKTPGSIRGVAALEPGDDSRTIFIIFLGTRSFYFPDDSIGNFTTADMAPGDYRVRIMTTTPNYGVLDTTLRITAGMQTTLPDTIRLPFTGIPVPTGLALAYDTMLQIVTLTWNKPHTGRPIAGYAVYRKHQDSTSFQKIAGMVTDTMYVDSTVIQDVTYEYRVAAVDGNGTEGVQSTATQVTIAGMFTVIDSIVKGYAVGVDGNFGQYGRGVLDSADNFYITDNTNKCLQKLGPTGDFIFKVGTFMEPVSITNFKDSALYICDYSARKIIHADLSGNIDTSFSTTGRPGGVCTRGDSVFVSSDSGVEIYSLAGLPLGILSNPFSMWLTQPNIVAGTGGKLYAIEDRGIFEVDLQSSRISSIWSFPKSEENQQAQIAFYGEDTLIVAALYMPQSPTQTGPQSVNSILYMVSTDGKLIGRWHTKDFISGIIRDAHGRLICFSDGRILFLQK